MKSLLFDLMTIISFFLTLGTFLAAINVRKQILHNGEKERFRTKKSEIISVLQGYELSIKGKDFLKAPFISDFSYTIQHQLTDIESSYTFLNRKTKKYIKEIKGYLSNQGLSEKEWHIVADKIIVFKNNLNKEV